MKSLAWKAYLPIPTRVRVSREDATWFAAHGISREMLGSALTVLRVLRREVLPLRNRLPVYPSISFLVHDRASGVPTKKVDKSTYVDAIFRFNSAVDARRWLPKKWKFVHSAKPTEAIAGIDLSILRDPSTQRVEFIIQKQSKIILDILAIHKPSASDVAVLKHLGQFLHYFANMTQMVIR